MQQTGTIASVKQDVLDALQGRTDVSDASIPVLRRLTMLRKLDITRTRITEEGIAKLQKALPALMIER